MRTPSFHLTIALTLTSFAALAACGDPDPVSPVDAAIDAPTDAPEAAPTCAAYCTAIAANCTAANLMYASAGDCMASCGRLAVGTAADTSGNTLGCRLYHANNAAGSAGNANTHCRHAGPGGDGVCGANCEGFCTIVQGSCSTQQPPPYASAAACMTACAGYATTPPYVSGATGNNLACRLYHATAASALPATHCPHTGSTSVTCVAAGAQ